MSDRWFIYKDGQALGPFTPEEIRQSLREGNFDPFDLVSRAGSSVRRELVEVDELFFTSKVIYGDDQGLGVGPAAVDGGALGAFAPSGNLPAVREATQASLPSAGDMRATQASAPAPRALAGQQGPRKRRRDPKHFHVMDPRGRVLGPISAGEIQALFYKGVLDKNVKVMRDNSKAQVPVSRFVAIYSESNKVKRAMQQGAHPMVQGGISRAGLPMPRAAMGSSSSPVSAIAVIAIVAALVLGGMAVYIFVTNGAMNWSAKETPAETRPERRVKKRTVRPLPEQAQKQAQPQARVPSRSTVAEQKRMERITALKRQREKLLELKQRREARDKSKRKNKFAQTVATKPKTVTPLPVTPLPLPKPAVVPVPPKPQGQTVGSLTDGQQVVKLGPMSFDKSTLKACDGSCNLSFSGAGGTVKVAFFKQVWGPALEAKSGGVYLSGLVKKNGADTKIILSNVQ